jgi:hypothetical protein
MLSSHESTARLPVRKIIVISLTTWLIAVLGWEQALNIINADDFQREQINIPSFFSTLFVLPLPYGAYLLFGHLLRKYPTAPWKRLLDNSIIFILLAIIGAQVLAVGVLFYLGLAAGGLDLMFPWQTWIFFEAILYALPITILVTLSNLLLFLGFEEKSYVYWLLLPALLVNGATVFRLGFLLLGMQA